MSHIDLSLGRPAQLPDYAHPWRVRYARWDGGPVEAAKGVLSRWLYMPEPDSLQAVTDWYTPQTLELLDAAGVNWVWVTWSVGFPPEDEAEQWRIVREYITLCHARGIHVTAYLSMVNMMYDLWMRRRPEADAWIQRTRQGERIPYGAAIYPEGITRYIACLSHPDWQQHLLKVSEAAVVAGADGIEFDNAGSGCQCPRCLTAFREYARTHFGREYGAELPDFGSVISGTAGLVNKTDAPPPDEQSALIWHRFVNHLIGQTYARVGAHIRQIKPDVLLYGNNNAGMYTFTYLANNAISTEDAAEPGWVEGRLVNNGGLLRLLRAASDGWKPFRLEYGVGHGGGELDKRIPARGVGSSRFWPMNAKKHRLAIAEAAAHGASMEVTPEGYFGVDLYFRRAEAMAIWQAVGDAHRFLAEHEDLYDTSESASRVAILVNDDIGHVAGHCADVRRADARRNDPQRRRLLDALSGAGLDFDALFDRQLPDANLSRYELLLLPDTRYLSEAMIASLREFAAGGGRVLVTGQAGRYDERFLPRAEWPLVGLPGMVHRPDLADERVAEDATMRDSFMAAIRDLTNAPTFEIEAPAGVLCRLVYQPRRLRYILHLLNYNDAPCGPVTLHGRWAHQAAAYTPDAPLPDFAARGQEFALKTLDIYAVVVIPLN